MRRLYWEEKTPPKWRTRKWTLLNAAWAPSGHTQITVSMTMAGCVCVHMLGRGDQVCMRMQACGASHTLARRRGTELVVARSARAGIERSPARELNPATPQHEAEGLDPVSAG